jgi:hypothetical protein
MRMGMDVLKGWFGYQNYRLGGGDARGAWKKAKGKGQKAKEELAVRFGFVLGSFCAGAGGGVVTFFDKL